MIARLTRLSLAVALTALPALPAAAQISGSPGYQFLQAVRNAKDDDVVKILAKPGTRIINTRDPSTGEGALHIVAKRGDIRYLNTLLQQDGVDVNIRDGMGNTPLIYAVMNGHDELVPLLLKAKANPNATNSAGDAPLMLAVLRRDVPLARDLLEGGADPDKADRAGRTVRDVVMADAERNRIMAQLFIDHPKQVRRAVSGPTL